MKSTVTCENKVNNNYCFYLYEYINNKKIEVTKMLINQIGNIMNIKEFIIAQNYNLKEAFNILLSNLLINNDFLSGGIKMEKDLGINDEEFLIGLEIINRINKNENIILKLFNFHPRGLFDDNYFQIKKPNFLQFLADFGKDDDLVYNKIIIVPINILTHFSLLLIYNKKMYILDFGLFFVIDDNKLQIQKELDDYDNRITDYLDNKKYNSSKIWQIIDKYENDSDIKYEEIRNIIEKKDQDNLFNLIKHYKLAQNKIDDIYFLKDNPRIDSKIFKNNNLEENIKILNLYAIQGSQSCGYFCLAAFEFIKRKIYNFENLLELFNDATFQINILKILCNEFIGDDRKIFKINEEMSKIDYYIYIKKNNKIGINKSINELRIKRNNNNYTLLNSKYFFDLKAIHYMLIDKGYKLE